MKTGPLAFHLSLLMVLALASSSLGAIRMYNHDDGRHEHVRLSRDMFEDCVQRCSNDYGDCLARIDSLWSDYFRNMDRIKSTLYDCCLFGEDDHDLSPSSSFSTCVRDRCGAELWGCQVEKRHTGQHSPEEIRRIEERRRRGRQ